MHNAAVSAEGVVVLMVSVFTAAVALTAFARAYAVRRALWDVPNERSSHSVPTPRGGGVSITLTFLCAVGVLWWWGILRGPLTLALAGGGAAVSAVGWADDHRHVSPAWRMLVHAGAAAWAVWLLWGVGTVAVAGKAVAPGWAGPVLAVVGVVWLTNLYNFMDGIDGLAGAEAVTAGGGGALLLWGAGDPGLALAAAALAAAAGGFLVWNWPPARIFMGDVGSGLLGYAFGVLAVAGEGDATVPVAIWVILLAVFIADATYTLLMRVGSGARWYTAHRSHAYQRAVQTGLSHRRVTVAAAGVNLLVLLPLAAWAVRRPGLQPWIAAGVMLAGLLAWWAVQRRWRVVAGP